MAIGRSPKIKGSTGFLIEQRAKHFGIAFAIDLRIPESGRFCLRHRPEICFNIDCSIFPPSLASAEFFYQHKKTAQKLQ